MPSTSLKLLLLLLTVVLYSLDSTYTLVPVVITLSSGRSGSTMFCEILANLVGMTVHGALKKELFGGSRKQMQAVVDPVMVMRDHLRSLRKIVKPDQYIGFKWKPYFDSDLYDQAFRYGVKHKFKFIISTRNPLDVFISSAKHQMANESVPAHCTSAHCTEGKQSIKLKVNADKALNSVHRSIKTHALLVEKLKAMGADFITVTYEQFVATTADEVRLENLKRVANFLATENQHYNASLTAFELRTVDSSSHHQRDVVINFDELAAAMRADGLGHLLHDKSV